MSRWWLAAVVVGTVALPLTTRAEDPSPGFQPTIRAGFRAGAFGLIDPRSPGIGAEVAGTLGWRFATRWSLVADTDIDVGWWSAAGSPLLFGWSVMAGVDYTARDAFARGSSWQAGILIGPWMAAICDPATSPRCETVLPATTFRWSVLPESGHTPRGPRASWDVGIAATLGYDPGVTELVGRVVLFAGVEWF